MDFLIDYINDLLMFNVSQPLDLQSMVSERESYQSQNRMATRIERSLNWNPSQCPTELSKVMAWFDRYNLDLLSGDHLTKVPALANLIELRCMIRSNEEFTVCIVSP